MSDRMRPRDVAFLAAETPESPRHNATVEIFDPRGSTFDFDRFVQLVGDRISFVPRYRQRVVDVPGHVSTPVWVDDDHFDLAYHVRRSALPRPGSGDQLRELAARIVSRPLDRTRPLWEIYVVEGLADDRVALLHKTHQALVDGVHTVDLGQLLLDDKPEQPPVEGDDWSPRRRPSAGGLLLGAVKDSVSDQRTLVDTARVTSTAALRAVERSRTRVRHVAGALTGRRTERTNALQGPISQQRRLVGVDTRLTDYQRIRDAHGCSVNDVILATITGALRAWMMTRHESLGGLRQVRAVVPVSVIDDDLEPTSMGSQIAAHLVDLPVAEPSPLVRLHQVAYSFAAHQETVRGVSASRLANLAGFAPATFHAVGSRVAAHELTREVALSVTNVPGPQTPLYAAGARMVATYPAAPLLPGHPLAIGVTSYDGHVYYGLTADRDWLPDADLLGSCLVEALDELLDSASGVRPRASRGRKR